MERLVVAMFLLAACGNDLTTGPVDTAPDGGVDAGPIDEPRSLAILPGLVSFDLVELGAAPVATVRVRNTSSHAVIATTTLDTVPAFAMIANTCGDALAAFAECTVTVQFAPVALGLASAQLTVGGTMVTLSGHGATRVTVMNTGSGSNRVTSTPVGISCYGGNACSALFTSGPVVLTAETNTSFDVFTGWSVSACGTASTCELDVGGPAHSIVAGFEPVVRTMRVGAPGFDFGLVQTYTTETRAIPVANLGNVAVEITSVSVGPWGDFTVESTTCIGVLAPQSTCTANVTFRPTFVGAVFWTGLYVSASDNASAVGALNGTGAYRVTIERSGRGDGAVASSLPGIACGTTCTGLFVEPITLSATASDGYFAGWGGSGPCSGNAAVCTVKNTTQVVAIFETLPSDVPITFAGSAAGEVRVVDLDNGLELQHACTASCTARVPIGHRARITAATPSLFGGIAGACGASSPELACDFVAAGGAADALTATFVRAPTESWTALLPANGNDVLVPDGAVIASTYIGMHGFTEQGTPMWPTDGRYAYGVARTTTSETYVKRLPTIELVDAHGAVVWSRPLGEKCNGTTGRCIASGPADEVAMHGATNLIVWNHDGSVRWSRPIPADGQDGVAFSPDGDVWIASADGSGGLVAERHAAADAADGTPGVRIPLASTTTYAWFVFDASGGLVASTYSTHAKLERHALDGSLTWSRTANAFVPRVSRDPQGRIAWVRTNIKPDGSIGDWVVELVDVATGAPTKTLSHPRYGANGALLGTVALDVALAPDDHMAVTGYYFGLGASGGFVTLYTP
jgi:hypothetical protein